MKIEFDKAFIWLLPYLYFVSICYYWGYWGTFDVDAINYYPASDLVKGIASPIISTIAFVVLSVIFFQIANPLVAYINKVRPSLPKLFALLGILFLISFALFYFVLKRYEHNELFNPIHLANSKSTFIKYELAPPVAIIVLAFIIHNKYISKTLLLPSWWLFFLLLLPQRAFSDGKTKALSILNSSEFDYIIADSLAVPQKSIYKYLGKAGDYHILENAYNTKSIIVPTSKIAPLIIEKFSIDDTASIRRIRAHSESLAIQFLQVKNLRTQK